MAILLVELMCCAAAMRVGTGFPLPPLRRRPVFLFVFVARGPRFPFQGWDGQGGGGQQNPFGEQNTPLSLCQEKRDGLQRFFPSWTAGPNFKLFLPPGHSRLPSRFPVASSTCWGKGGKEQRLTFLSTNNMSVKHRRPGTRSYFRPRYRANWKGPFTKVRARSIDRRHSLQRRSPPPLVVHTSPKS